MEPIYIACIVVLSITALACLLTFFECYRDGNVVNRVFKCQWDFFLSRFNAGLTFALICPVTWAYILHHKELYDVGLWLCIYTIGRIFFGLGGTGSVHGRSLGGN